MRSNGASAVKKLCSLRSDKADLGQRWWLGSSDTGVSIDSLKVQTRAKLHLHAHKLASTF
jgi:hypothetical protein